MQFPRLFAKGAAKKPTRAEWRPSHEVLSFEVHQDGNRLAVMTDNLVADIEVKGIELSDSVDPSFAVWLLLPLAMEHGVALHSKQPLDPKVVDNAEKLSAIWEMWVPGRFRSIRVMSSEESHSQPAHQPSRRSAAALYSGGVDSTYALIRNASLVSHALTVQGQDYKTASPLDEARFERLLRQTQPLLDKLGLQRVIVKTSLRKYIRPGRLTHGFLLAGYSFLLSRHFSEALLGADYTPVQDMISAPWGTNHVSNQFFTGSDFAIRTVGNDAMRSEKIAFIAQDETALQSVSFCHNPDSKPDRCGVCRKCIRSKAMFVAATGSCPEIFVDMSLTEEHITSLGVERRNGRAALADLYACAKKNGRLNQIPGLEQLHNRLCAISKY